MRLERYIHQVGVEIPAAGESASEARERLREKFPRATLRRMTHLGMLLGSALERIALTQEDAVVYATSYAETRALEDFLVSFPAASPLLFQTSIHPGGIQQVLIGRQQPIARLWPLAGRTRLVEQALLTALLETAPRTVLLGGEETGTWLLEHGMASDRAFAFAIELRTDADRAVGKIALEPLASDLGGSRGGQNSAVDTVQPAPGLSAFVDALAGRNNLTWDGLNGAWSLNWA